MRVSVRVCKFACACVSKCECDCEFTSACVSKCGCV